MTGGMYARVFAEQRAISQSAAAEVAARWAAWAASRDDHAQAADAWWCWMTAVAADLRRRVLHDKERRISDVQDLYAVGADRLARAGRRADAALALDLGRAIILTERMHREREGLEGRLLAAGHAEHADHWRRAGKAIEETDSGGFSGGETADSNGLSGYASAEYAALAAHERLLGEIARLPGFEDVDASPVYDDLREAAAEGPIVYVASLIERGFALVVTESPEPTLVELPTLHRGRVDEHVALMRTAGGRRATARAMTTLLPALWTELLEPLMVYLPSASLVTLIPVGRVSELPLHMAGVAHDADGVWRDRTGGMAFCYAPNARVLRRSQKAARSRGDVELRVMTAGVIEAAGHPNRLRHAQAESDGVAARFGQGRSERPEPATVANVMRSLGRCEVWHFACHGEHDPVSPLESTLALVDGPLTVREMFARPSEVHRLAVLSACQTMKVDRARPDEALGFPAAMLGAGVAGVVACQADVEDDAAMLLVLSFFDRFAATGTPARALADAQAWLRTATNEEIHSVFPEVYPRPGGWDDLDRWRRYRPFAQPSTWALFSYTGA